MNSAAGLLLLLLLMDIQADEPREHVTDEIAYGMKRTWKNMDRYRPHYKKKKRVNVVVKKNNQVLIAFAF